MPLINLRTNISDVQAPDALLKKLSYALATATGKPESYVMTLLDSGVPMTFALVRSLVLMSRSNRLEL